MAKRTSKKAEEVKTVETVKTSRRGRKSTTTKTETMSAEVGMGIINKVYENLSELRFNEMCTFLMSRGYIKVDDLKNTKSPIHKIKKRWVDLVTTIEGGIDTNKKYDALKQLVIDQFSLKMFEDLLFSKGDFLQQFSWLIVKSTQFCVRYSLDRTALLQYFTAFGWDKISVFITNENWTVEVVNRSEKFVADFPDAFTKVEPTPEDPYLSLEKDASEGETLEAILIAYVTGYTNVAQTVERLEEFGYENEGALYIIDTFADDIYQDILAFVEWLLTEEEEAEEEEELDYSITDTTKKESKGSKKVVEETIEEEEDENYAIVNKEGKLIFSAEQVDTLQDLIYGEDGCNSEDIENAGLNIVQAQSELFSYLFNYVFSSEDFELVDAELARIMVKGRKVKLSDELISEFKMPRGFKALFTEALSARRINTRLSKLEDLLLEAGFSYEITDAVLAEYEDNNIDFTQFRDLLDTMDVKVITVLGKKVYF